MSREGVDPTHRTRTLVLAFFDWMDGPTPLWLIRKRLNQRHGISRDAVRECVARLYREGVVERVGHALYQKAGDR